MITITKEFELHSAHFLPLHEGKCKRPHGHGYKLFVEIARADGEDYVYWKTQSPQSGMVLDFGFLKEIINKEIINKYDHQLLNDFFKNPTAEVMVETFACIIKKSLEQQNCILVKLKLYETDTSYATWYNPLIAGR